MRKAIVVGSGAGGAAVARELQGEFAVTVLDAGQEFKPFSADLKLLAKFRKTGLFFDERLIQLLFPAMKIRKTPDKMALVNGINFGGSTALSAGNALRMDSDLKKLGIDLDAEFEEIYREIPITSDHRKFWRKTTQELYSICEEMGLNPFPTPKLIDFSKCKSCGKCVLGCRYGAKWDSRVFLREAIQKGAVVEESCRVEKVVIKDRFASGVEAFKSGRRQFFPADLVILSAGGLGTPVILEKSGIECDKKLFVDPVLCLAAESRGAFQNKEITMPFVVQKDNFIVSPYFDYVSFFFNRKWRYPAENLYGIMIKLADENIGYMSGDKAVKVLTEDDKNGLKQGIEICREMFQRMGHKKEDVFIGTLNAGHPGGMLPLTELEKDTLHHSRLPENLYVADASLFPHSLGNPPILTIIALAKKVGKACKRELLI